MITKIELSTAKMYAKMKDPSLYHKRTLITYFIKVHHNKTVRINASEEDTGFNEAYEEAKEYFNTEA